MLKRRIFFFLLFAASLLIGRGASAQKLYLFTGGDVQDEELGSAIEESASQVASGIEKSMPSEYLVRYNDSENSWNGPEIDLSPNARRDILAAIDSCPAGPDDAIFFYWCGHGAYDVQGGKKKHYLLMPNAGEESVMYRSEILDALKEKRPRLVVLITDSCNSFRKVTVEQMSRSFAPSIEPKEPTKPGIPPLFLSLFFQCRGTVDVNSSDWNQKAAIWEDGGSVFSSELSSRLTLQSDKHETWQDFLQQINGDLDQGIEVSGELGGDQETEKNLQSLRIWSLPKPDDSVTIPDQDIDHPNSDTGDNSTGDSPTGGRTARGNGRLSIDDRNWSDPIYRPENGDRIVKVNGTAIQNTAEFEEEIRNSDNDVILTLIGNRSGNPYFIRTKLLPRSYRSRLGIEVRDDGGDGVVVTGVKVNMPGNRCRYLQDGNVEPVRVRGDAARPVD